MFFSSRRRRGPDLHLDWKVRIFFFGAFLAFIGMATQTRWVVLVAIAVLLVGILLRFLPGPRSSEPSDDGPPVPGGLQSDQDDEELD